MAKENTLRWNKTTLKKIENFLATHHSRFTPASVTPFEWWLLATTTQITKPTKVLEIGCYKHCSSLAFLGAGVDIPKFTLTTLDDRFRKRMRWKGCEWTKIKGPSQESLPRIDDRFGLIFIDGDHSADGASTDLKNCLEHLEDDGIIFFHDANSFVRKRRGPALWKALQQYIPENEWLFFPASVTSNAHGLAVYDPSNKLAKLKLTPKFRPLNYNDFSKFLKVDKNEK